MAHGRSASRLPYFYPRPPRGGRLAVPGVGADPLRISIHALREEGDFAFSTISTMSSYFYPRPPRGGRPASDLGPWPPDPISIHALREEGDTYFYSTSTRNVKFLSTPSARRATVLIRCITGVVGISIHALREEGDPPVEPKSLIHFYFYPRPPRGGRRTTPPRSNTPSGFLSTPSARRATVQQAYA